MSVEISFGGTCRDISKLPEGPELKTFFMEVLAPAIFADFSRNIMMANGNGNSDRGDLAIGDFRGCEVGGTVTIKF